MSICLSHTHYLIPRTRFLPKKTRRANRRIASGVWIISFLVGSLKGFPGQSDNGTVHWTAKVVHFCSLISHRIESQCSIHGEVILCSASRGQPGVVEMQTRQLMEIIYVLCTLYCTTIFGHSIEAVTKAEILPAVQKSVCVHTPTCQSVDSYRSHHMKPHTRQFWALANQHLRSCRQFLARQPGVVGRSSLSACVASTSYDSL